MQSRSRMSAIDCRNRGNGARIRASEAANREVSFMQRSAITRVIGALAGVAATALVLSACAADAPATDPNGADAGPIRIGASLPLTGEFSQGGLDTQQGYEVWVELQNEAGGLLDRDVEIIVKDDATNQNT